MPTYQTKPWTVEAEQWFPDRPDVPGAELCDPGPVRLNGAEYPRGSYWVVRTVLAVIHLEPGDWVVKDRYGNYRVLKPEIFEANYESVPSPAQGV